MNFDKIVKCMTELAADDFGTGYASVQHLQRFPIATLKIDRSFIQRLCESSRSYPIVMAVIEPAHNLKGSERPKDRRRLDIESSGLLMIVPGLCRECMRCHSRKQHQKFGSELNMRFTEDRQKSNMHFTCLEIQPSEVASR